MNTSSTDANYHLWLPFVFNESATEDFTTLKFESPVNDTTLLSMFQPLIGHNFLPYQWLCNANTYNRSCTTQQANSFESSWQILPPNYPIETCYSETVPSLCKLEYGSLLVCIVLICNVVKTACMSITARKLWKLDNPILATIGDATASFLEMPDQTTSCCCLMDGRSIKAWKKKMPVRNIYGPPKTLRFFRAVSLTRWSITLLSCLAFIGVSSWLCSKAVSGMESFTNLTSVTQVWDSGFGSVNPNAILNILGYPYYIGEGNINIKILANVLIANSPQLILSVCVIFLSLVSQTTW